MSKKISAIRGMKDILPNQTLKWQQLEALMADMLVGYGYEQIRTPFVEKTEVFHRSIGQVTDIVSKEMYVWQDNNGDNISLRPEGTASTVRAMIEHNLVRERLQKVWYLGAMFRRERPQKGRYRQFYQLGVEVFGLLEAKVDAELIAMTHQLWQKLNIKATLEINSLGSLDSRASYKLILLDYLIKHQESLDEDSLKRLYINPLRILDSKNPDLQTLIANAPKISNHLDKDSQTHFNLLCQYLESMNIPYVINDNLVRGLDYYNKTVFEWINDDLGSQGTICAGGRYDGLFVQMGGNPTPATGFAIGLDRLMLLLDQQKTLTLTPKKSLYIITQGIEANLASFALANHLREALPDFIVHNDASNTSLKSQFKKADKYQADFAIILAEDEVKSNQLSIKPLKNQGKQTSHTLTELIKYLTKN